MKSWKLISGILSIVFAGFVVFQSFAAGLADALGGTDTGASAAGLVVAILMLAAGVVSIVTRKKETNGGNIAMIILFGIAAVIGFTFHGTFEDLQFWAGLCVVCAVVAALSARANRKK